MKLLKAEIRSAIEGLYFISETDAPFELAEYTKINFNTWFSKLTKTEDWHGDAERLRTENFKQLKILLAKNLTCLQVFKIGVAPAFNYYISGYTKTRQRVIIKTEAIET